MNYKKFFIILFLFIYGCQAYDTDKQENVLINKKNFINRGFAIVYNDDLYNQKIVSKKIDSRSLIIFQKNLKKGTKVRVKNILNNKTIIANVGVNAKYPIFNNSVLSKRISKEIDLDLNNPYIEIVEILEKSLFIAKKAKTFEEEKQVANKAPIDEISVNNLNDNSKKIKKIEKVNNNKFNYIIKVADFYFEDTAFLMIKRIETETLIKKAQVKKISNTQYRVFVGPFDNINSLQKVFNDINILQFENIEIIRKWKKFLKTT